MRDRFLLIDTGITLWLGGALDRFTPRLRWLLGCSGGGVYRAASSVQSQATGADLAASSLVRARVVASCCSGSVMVARGVAWRGVAWRVRATVAGLVCATKVGWSCIARWWLATGTLRAVAALLVLGVWGVVSELGLWCTLDV